MKFLNISFALNKTELFSDPRMLALLLTVSGFAVIFFLLGIIWFGMQISRQKSKNSEPVKAAGSLSKNSAGAEDNTINTDETAVVAAITAAIAAYYSSAGKANTGFRVVSFKRTGDIRPWNK